MIYVEFSDGHAVHCRHGKAKFKIPNLPNMPDEVRYIDLALTNANEADRKRSRCETKPKVFMLSGSSRHVFVAQRRCPRLADSSGGGVGAAFTGSLNTDTHSECKLTPLLPLIKVRIVELRQLSLCLLIVQ
jgi:hypothetical protein